MGFKELITPSTGPSVAFPCIWQQIKSQDSTVRTATFTNWDWFWYVTSMGLPNAIDFDYYCDNYATCDPELVSRAADYLNRTLIGSTAESSYTFVYIGNVDEFGHTYGWCTPKYMEEVDIADQLVGQLLDVVDASGLADTDVTVMLSSDHGGHLRGHGAETDSDIVIPAFVRGPGIRRGVEFRHEVSNVDYVPTAMEMLGLKPSPWWKGHVLWEAFESTPADAIAAGNLIKDDKG
jgi:predicted AlkP superfamily pyrophosphatase or phosphodiesterase